MYGITETTVHVTYYPREKADTIARGASPIGYRIPDLTIYILDEQGQPVPLGVAGELYVGGAGVARGYLNRPELTATRFLVDPFRADARSRMYRTGDVGRFRADGSIEYLGRMDFQVKLRGYRIELGEIENRLLEHPQLREALVLAREDRPGDKRLVAYVIPARQMAGRHGSQLDINELRRHLQTRLPEYMVPSAFVVLSALPLTSNGKVDRNSLPTPEYQAEEYLPPQTEGEQTIVAIFEELLGATNVSRSANFFSIGGNSLYAGIACNRLSASFGVTVSIRMLFENPTVQALSTVILQLITKEDGQDLTSLLESTENMTAEEVEEFLKRGLPGAPGRIEP
jgi:hypothetical protein